MRVIAIVVPRGADLPGFLAAERGRYAAIIGAEPPVVVRSVIRGRGRAPLFQIRVPAKSRDDANGICQRLHAAGGACIVFRN